MIDFISDARNLAGILFLAFWIVLILYIGEKREHELCSDSARKAFSLLSPTAKKQLIDEWEDRQILAEDMSESMSR